MTDNRYEQWHCTKCGRLRYQRAVPHCHPTCCGDGMWWDHLYVGPVYEVEEVVE